VREAAGSRLIQLLIVAAISIALLAYGIDRATVAAPFTDTVSKLRAQDESGYANSALGLARDGGWLTPKVLGRFLLYKPPLLVWLAGLSLKIFGTSLWALRLPALIAAVLATVIVFWWARRERLPAVACAAVVLLLSNPLWHGFARLCYTDMLAVAAMVGALAILYANPRLETRLSLWGFAVCTATGVMAKSVAGLLPLFVLFLYSVIAGRKRRPAFFRIALVMAAAVVLVAPWHIYQLAAHGQWFWADYIQVQLLGYGLHPEMQTSQEGQIMFYIRRLALIDPVMFVLLLTSLPFLIAALRDGTRTLPALLAAWLGVTAGALLLFRYRNLPYALFVIPPACLIAAAYNPIFTSKRAKWGLLAALAIFGWKCCQPDRTWGLSFGKVEPLSAAAALRSYCDRSRSNELILANTDDQFYSSTLPLPRVRFFFSDPSDSIRKSAPHFTDLGITLTEEQFERLDELEPLYAGRLKSWGLDSTYPIGTTIAGRSEDALLRLVRARPESDYYVTNADLALLEREGSVQRTHEVMRLPNERAFLLARISPKHSVNPPHAALPAKW